MVFILADGSFVVQWDEKRVQELLTGRYRPYVDTDFGHAITDYELNQLKAAGRVEHYNRQYVWLYALPEAGRYNNEARNHYTRIRSYYLNTTLPKSRLDEVQALLRAMELDGEYLARARSDLVAVLGKNGAPFHNLQEAETAQKHLMARAPAIFEHSAIAFVETASSLNSYKRQTEHSLEPTDLTNIIASQTDTGVTAGKRVVLVVGDDDERAAIRDLLLDMVMDVHVAQDALHGLQLLEDCDPHLLIMDLQLPDMHGWQLLAKIKEIESLRDLPKIIIADHSALPDTQVFALTVVKVDVFLVKPLSMAQLRQNIWLTLKERDSREDAD
jgi:CheY-like chemotaxis protein